MPLFYSTAGLAMLSMVAAASSGQSFGQLTDDVNDSLDSMRQKVDSWDRSQGLTGALGIQSTYPELLRRVQNLQSASANTASADVNTQQLEKLANTIAELLQSLSQKEGDLSSVGAKAIGGSDISQLQQPTIDIMTSIITAVSKDCGKLEQLDSAVKKVAQAFASVDRVYGLQSQEFPTVPACKTSASTEYSAELEVPVLTHTPEPPHITTTPFRNVVNGSHHREVAAALPTGNSPVQLEEAVPNSSTTSTVTDLTAPGIDSTLYAPETAVPSTSFPQLSSSALSVYPSAPAVTSLIPSAQPLVPSADASGPNVDSSLPGTDTSLLDIDSRFPPTASAFVTTFLSTVSPDLTRASQTPSSDSASSSYSSFFSTESAIPTTEPSLTTTLPTTLPATVPLFPGNTSSFPNNGTLNNSTASNSTLPLNSIAGPSQVPTNSVISPAFKNTASSYSPGALLLMVAGLCVLL